MSDTAKQLIAWLEYGRALKAALPPVDEEMDRRATAALNKRREGYVPRKLTRKTP